MKTYQELRKGWHTVNSEMLNPEEYSRWVDWNRFQFWQAAVTMNQIFGHNYVEVPPIPEGYEAHGIRWFENNFPYLK